MRYIEAQDYLVFCDEFERRVISEHPEEWEHAEAMAIELVGSYLRGRYDYDRALGMKSDRNPMLVQVIVVVALWYLVHRLPQQMSYERRQPLYEEALLWLKDAQSGKCLINLPRYTDSKGEERNNPIRFGSLPPNQYDY